MTGWAELMEISISQQSEVTVVTVNGSVDSADSESLQTLFNELFDQSQTRVVADLGQMDFVCSMGLGVLVRTYTSLRERGGFLRLARPQPVILKLIKMTGLDRLLPIYDSVEQALE